MKFYDYLLETFGKNEPIFSSEIQYTDYSKPWIAKELNRLCNENELVRYERGIYYIPTKTPFGNSILNPNKVIERKYLTNSSGFYSGLTALNMLGLSTQMPNSVEICTNNETSKLRIVKVGSQSVELRRSRVEINSENIDTLSFLELMNTVATGFFNDDRRNIMLEWLSSKNVTRKSISEYSRYYPDKTMRNLVDSEVIYYVTQ